MEEAEGLDGVLDVVAEALQLPPPGQGAGAIDRIGRALAARGPLLLVLDDVDRAVEATASCVARWQEQAPETEILCSSRQRLSLPAETVYELEPLELPSGPKGAAETEAVLLFVETVRRVDGRWALDDADLPYVAEIVRLLDGIPLAIELAAARIAVMGPRPLLHRLRNRFDVLGSGRRGAPPRHATLRTAVEFSWAALRPPEQRALACCSVFRGGFSLEAAESIVLLPDDSPPAVDVLQTLRERSLLHARERALVPGERRLGLYAAIGEVAADHLAESDLQRELEAIHAAYFVARARREAAEPGGWLWLVQERENLLAVAERVLDRGPVTARAAEPALEALLLLEGVLLRRGPLERYAALFQPVLDATARSGADPHLYCRALATHGTLLRHRGRGVEGAQGLVHALTIARETGDRDIVGRSTLELGQALASAGESASARDHLQRALKIFEELDDDERRGTALRGLAGLESGRPARDLYEQALALHGSAPYARAEDLLLLARFEIDGGRHDAASAMLGEAHDACTAADHRRGVAMADGLLALTRHIRGDVAEAIDGYETALQRLAELGFGQLESEYTLLLGLLCEEDGRGAEARALLTRARRMLDDGDQLHQICVGHQAATDALTAGQRRTAEDEIRRLEQAPEPTAVARLSARALRAQLAAAGERTIGEVPQEDLVIGPAASWFRAPDGERVGLHHRPPMQRVLAALANQRIQAPGVALSAEGLLAAGWPDERVIPEAGRHRVRVAISSLRKMGLGVALRTEGSAYLLDPAVTTHLLK